MLSVCCWKWGSLFSAEHVNVLRSMLARNLDIDHTLYCVTDDPTGLDGDIVDVEMPTRFADTPRCRRRMQQYSREFAYIVGGRMLAIDIDVVIVDDITPIVDRPEPIVGWKVGHAGVYSGSFLLCDTGALHDAWAPFEADPVGYPASLGKGTPSDQAMLNAYLETQPPIPFWTESDGFVSYYGAGYERLEHLGVGPRRRQLPKGARIVVLGSADIDVLEKRAYPWIEESWR